MFGAIPGVKLTFVYLKGKNAATGELVAIKKIFKGGMRSEQLKQFLKAVEVRKESLFKLQRSISINKLTI